MLVTLAALLILAGSALTLVAALGVLRLPDFFMRMHAATKAGVAGPSLMLLGVGCFDMSLATWIKIGATVLFLTLTTSVAGHILGKAGFLGGVTLWSGTSRNDLAQALHAGEFREKSAEDPAAGLADTIESPGPP